MHLEIISAIRNRIYYSRQHIRTVRFLLGDPNSIAAVVKDKHGRRPIKSSISCIWNNFQSPLNINDTVTLPSIHNTMPRLDILKYRRVAITVVEWKEIFRCRRDATPYCINCHRGNPFSMFPRPWIHRADPPCARRHEATRDLPVEDDVAGFVWKERCREKRTKQRRRVVVRG